MKLICGTTAVGEKGKVVKAGKVRSLSSLSNVALY